jgi:hypothetical protein
MTAEARSAAAESDPARSPAAVAHSARQHWRSGHASRSSRALTRTGAAPVRDDPRQIVKFGEPLLIPAGKAVAELLTEGS